MADKHASVERYLEIHSHPRGTHVPETANPTYHVPHILSLQILQVASVSRGRRSALSWRRVHLVLLHRVLLMIVATIACRLLLVMVDGVLRPRTYMSECLQSTPGRPTSPHKQRLEALYYDRTECCLEGSQGCRGHTRSKNRFPRCACRDGS
jgi:hypothetical protein